MLVNNSIGNSRDPKTIEDPEYLMRFEDPECFEDPGPNNCPQVIPENKGVNFDNIKGIT
mgnify:CR=1 FL=1